MDEHGKIEATWEAPEYIHYEKKVDWYWALGIITIATSIATFIYGNVLFGVFIIIAGSSLAIFAHRKPEMIVYTISEEGIQIGKFYFPYRTIKAFWIDNEPHPRELVLHTDRSILPHVTVPVPENVDTQGLRSFLKRFLKEEEMHEPGFHKVFDRIGF